MAGASREAVIDFDFLRVLCVPSATAGETFRFKICYNMADHGSSENCINWAYGHIEYKNLRIVITEAVAGFAHL